MRHYRKRSRSPQLPTALSPPERPPTVYSAFTLRRFGEFLGRI